MVHDGSTETFTFRYHKVCILADRALMPISFNTVSLHANYHEPLSKYVRGNTWSVRKKAQAFGPISLNLSIIIE